MPKRTKVAKKCWDEDDMKSALSEITGGSSIRAMAAKYGMSEGNIRHRRNILAAGKSLSVAGRPSVLNAEQEKQLAECIGSMCRMGFSPSREQIKELVQEYVRIHGLKTPFKDDRPGKDWLRLFMDRNRLSLKKANMISPARKSSPSNPFIIFDFYDVLENVVAEGKLGPSQIWNCDESGFPTDPQKCRVVGPKGEVAYKLTCGAGRENITTLAVCNAAGKTLDPLIVFSGKNLQSTWRPDDALPDTWYGISDSGWMTTTLFTEWFKLFCGKVKERPLLFILDGHLTHVSIPLIEHALKENVTILKLPPHVMDKLQPLDVACFGPLKREWELTLNNHISAVGPKTNNAELNICF